MAADEGKKNFILHSLTADWLGLSVFFLSFFTGSDWHYNKPDASLSCPLSAACRPPIPLPWVSVFFLFFPCQEQESPTCAPDRPSKILLVQVWTLSSTPPPPSPVWFSLFSFFQSPERSPFLVRATNNRRKAKISRVLGPRVSRSSLLEPEDRLARWVLGRGGVAVVGGCSCGRLAVH